MIEGPTLTAPWLAARERPYVAYVAQLPDYSGAEIGQLPIIEADADPLVICPPGSRMEQLVRSRGIPTAPLPFRSLRHSGGAAETLRSVIRGLASARDLRRQLRAHPERRLIYCMQIRPALIAALASLGLGRRVVCNITDCLPPAPLKQLIRLALALTGCDVVSHSQLLARDFAGGSRRLADRMAVIYPGVDLHRFSAVEPSPGRPRAAIVGHISPTKQTHVAVEIACRVREQDPSFELAVLGRAQYREEDFAYERELHARVEADPLLRKAVDFRGYVKNVPAALGEMGMLLHVRPDEPFGQVVIQAMAAGLPVVAPRSGGPLESVVDGETGLLFEPGDVEQAAACVLRLVRNPAEASAMGLAGRRRAQERFSIAGQLAETDRFLAASAMRLG